MQAGGNGFVWTRRIVVSFVVVAVSLSGHAAGSALLPSFTGLVLAATLSLALTAVVRAGMSAVRLFGLILGVQALLHAVFVLSSDCASTSMGSMSLVPSTVSLAGHVVASVVVVAVLSHGDQVLTSWTALLSSVLQVPQVALPAVTGRPVLPVPAWDARTHNADPHLCAQVRRGPPSI